MANIKVLGIIAVVGIWFIASFATYTVDERERAIKFRLGEIIDHDIKPGLHFMVPFVNNVRKFDARIQTLDSAAERYLTSEKKNVIVDSFVKWKIENIGRFYTATKGTVDTANDLLSRIIKDGLRDEFGKRTIQEVISGERQQIMDVLNTKASRQAEELGLKVVDVRIKRIDLPPQVSNSVYQRMEAERERVAKDLRSKGAEAAERIQAEADRQRTVLLAEAYRDAEQIRGEGDAQAADIYANAYNQDREFYALYRSLDAYGRVFAGKEDVLVLDPKSEFFKYLTSSTGK